jgi:hypothetical protein
VTSHLHRIVPWSAAGGGFRAAAAVLLLAYIGLAGEAIHCQYFPAAHNEHSDHSPGPAPATGHDTHCLVANHAGSVVVDSDPSTPLEAPTPTLAALPDDRIVLLSHLVRLTPARAPPLT